MGGQLGDRWWSSWVETMVVLSCSGEGGMMEGKGVRGGFVCGFDRVLTKGVGWISFGPKRSRVGLDY